MSHITRITRMLVRHVPQCRCLRVCDYQRQLVYTVLYHSSGNINTGNKIDVANIPCDQNENIVKDDLLLTRKFRQNPSKMTQRDLNKKECLDFDKLKEDARWAESFGSLADDSPEFRDIEIEEKRYPDDEGEDDSFEEPYRRLAKVGRRHSPNWYGRQIEKLAKQGKIYECIEMLEKKMLKEDRVMPNEYVFTVLIGALGRVGYTKKAFQLFKKMTDYSLKPEDPTYTALFNACSNCPWPEYGLKKAKILKEKMVEKSHQPNQLTFKAMIKAFGRCGDIVTAFSVVDEMIAAHLRIDDEVFSMLLQACISDKEAGLRHAIQVWHRINKLKRKRKLMPTIFLYNLFLRAVRHCGTGDPVLLQPLIQDGLNNLLSGGSHNRELSDGMSVASDQSQNEITSSNAADSKLPEGEMLEIRPVENMEELTEPVEDNLPEINVTSHSWWSYNSEKMLGLVPAHELAASESHSLAKSKVPDLATPEGRLAMFGGLERVLTSMEQDRVHPDIRTFTQLLDMIPSNLKAEHDLLSAMEDHGVKADVDFFNLLIRKRNLRRDYKHAKEVMSMIAKNGLTPNNFTFGCLAMGCPKIKDGIQLIADMQEAGLNISVEICNILISRSRMNFFYKLSVLQTMKQLGIKPNEITIRTIERHIKTGHDAIVAEEKGMPVKWKLSPTMSKEFGLFMKYYKSWLLTMGLEREPHPWEQFKKPTPESDEQTK